MVHFNWTQLIPGVEHGNIHVATAVVAALVMVLMAVAGRLVLGRGNEAVVPEGKANIKGVFEALTEFIIGLSDMVLGEKGRELTPMFGAIFLYLLVNNLLGLVPGMTPATDNINTTFAVGAFSFFVYNYYGFKEHGIAYLKQFLGPVLLMAPLMLVIELISHIVRPFSLGLRLMGNMMGDHTVLAMFTDLVPYLVPVPFYFLGLFVCFMQAFVFTMLSMIYVSMAVSHDH